MRMMMMMMMMMVMMMMMMMMMMVMMMRMMRMMMMKYTISNVFRSPTYPPYIFPFERIRTSMPLIYILQVLQGYETPRN